MIETAGIINSILGFVSSVVWAGAVILLFSALIGRIWADIWFQKERQAYQEEIEQYKTLIEEYIGILRDSYSSKDVNYLTQNQFDKEKVFYQNLSESSFALIESVDWLFPIFDELPNNEEERKKLLEKRYNDSLKNYNQFIRHLGKAAPFINREIYYMFEKFRKEAHHQIVFFPDIRLRKDGDAIKLKSSECYANTDNIAEIHQEIMSKLHNYIETQKISD